MSKRFKTLKIWKKSTELSLDVYGLTKNFPKEELSGITYQIRRASVSVSTNIAEGSDMGTIPQFIRYVNISKGSLNEVDNLVYLSRQLGYISNKDFDDLNKKIEELGKMLEGYRKYLKIKKEKSDEKKVRALIW